MTKTLSILIPTYNYNVLPLVTSLHQQAEKLDLEYEIRVYDDHSPQAVAFNEEINELSNCSFTILDKNIGRSAIRNKLATDARYSMLLFLDADTAVIRENFIETYLNSVSDNTQIIYGGIEYQKDPPPAAEILRWKYGNDREALTVTERNRDPHLRFLTLNFLIAKGVFDRHRFNEEIPNLRHEDTLFALDSKKKGIHVSHIDNPVVHLGLESSEVFLQKSMESVQALYQFVSEGLINAEETALSKKAESLQKKGLATAFLSFYNAFSKKMKKNLLSKNPSLFVFDLYRLGYYLKLLKGND
ncbi:glycosyltransferase family 2 protein [Constantimarinum furrinae]|uniref:Glycosyltransferase family 2 protein n=1 Tax=Constantimarinum furrinae TaxID=2562285 RepID=A0A7G8PV65_9FLAO|nr:glycosyltransferase [Constantimarinum furrinae]QNJ98231.1 glycosyltransferase family 2 protein [Constantimarinum furrinae]